ncbi:MAG TPA: transporter substrate-binding domain-containing protein [Alphaproteobacteria bacterium]|nr:transporter substrate-binding domain-containing protein [Alphaproteobacteria bacterium]
MKRSLLAVTAALAFAANAASAAEVKAAIGLSLPPYVIEAEKRGMEYDIVKEALAAEGHVLVPVFLPFARVVKAMQDKEVDAALTVNESSGVEAAYSDSHVTYRNYAITLADKGVKVESVADLKDKSVVAFQNAGLYLGDAYKAAVSANKSYREEAKQELQNTLLYSGKIDVVVGDGNIFNWYNKEVAGKVDTSQKVTLHPIFEPTPYKVAFRDPAMRDAFNRGLAKLKASGAYDKIVAQYGQQ